MSMSSSPGALDSSFIPPGSCLKWLGGRAAERAAPGLMPEVAGELLDIPSCSGGLDVRLRSRHPTAPFRYMVSRTATRCQAARNELGGHRAVLTTYTALGRGHSPRATRRVGERSRRRRSWALSATTIVEIDIKMAPTAGDTTTPAKASTPAASGTVMTLYPVAQIRFCHILR